MVATDDLSQMAPPDTSRAAISVRGLSKTYGGRQVVAHVDLEVPQGHVVALLGPNGAGKTTTVECIEGFRTPDAGSVAVLGLDPVADRARLTPRLGVMLQEGGVWPAATPREVLGLYARLHPQRWDPQDLLERLELGAVARSRYRTLSGGEKQRLNLALALVGKPQVLILDEPTTGMDPEVRQSTWELIRGLRDDGVTVLMTTHFMQEADHLADQVAVMARGQILAHDTPAALVARYGPSAITIITPDRIDAAALSSALGGVAVTAEGADRWLVQAEAAATQGLLAPITAWFGETGHHLTGVTTGGEGLETAYLELTQQAFGEPARLPDSMVEVT
jgi:ABC-2 type transport system ATP-binding protein